MCLTGTGTASRRLTTVIREMRAAHSHRQLTCPEPHSGRGSFEIERGALCCGGQLGPFLGWTARSRLGLARRLPASRWVGRALLGCCQRGARCPGRPWQGQGGESGGGGGDLEENRIPHLVGDTMHIDFSTCDLCLRSLGGAAEAGRGMPPATSRIPRPRKPHHSGHSSRSITT